MRSQVFTTPYAGTTSVEAYGPCIYHAVQPPHSVSSHSKKGAHLFMKALHGQQACLSLLGVFLTGPGTGEGLAVQGSEACLCAQEARHQEVKQ